MSIRKFKVRKYKHPRLKWVLNYREDGKRKRMFFETEAQATAEATLKNAQLKKSGIEGAEFSSRLRVMAQECSERLRKYGKTIADATDFLVSHLKASEESCTTATLIDQPLKRKKQAVRASDTWAIFAIDSIFSPKHSDNKRSRQLRTRTSTIG